MGLCAFYGIVNITMMCVVQEQSSLRGLEGSKRSGHCTRWEVEANHVSHQYYQLPVLLVRESDYENANGD